MGDLDADTRLAGGEGHYTATLSADWKIWGPNGGYVAAIALRAAGLESRLTRPASFSCQFLEAGAFEPARGARRGAAPRARRRGAQRLARAVRAAPADRAASGPWGSSTGSSTTPRARRQVPSPEDLLPIESLLSPSDGAAARVLGKSRAAPDRLGSAGAAGSHRSDRALLVPLPAAARFQDPFLDAARCLILLDTMSWPAVRAAYVEQPAYLAPSLDVSAQFHALAPESDWLLCETTAEIARDGLIGYRSRVWSEDRHLLASGGGQLLCRPAPAGVMR